MQLVELKPILPDTTIYDLRYSTLNNITGRVLNTGDNAVPKLNAVAAKSLAQAAVLLAQQNLRLVFWDAYRPVETQRQLLKINNDSKYVLDPETSKHPQGLAVDITLANLSGDYLDMGTDFDDFTTLAHAFPKTLGPQIRKNRDILNFAMAKNGFEVWPYEWWHFDFKE